MPVSPGSKTQQKPIPDLSTQLSPVLDKVGLGLMRAQARLHARLGEPMSQRGELEMLKLNLPKQLLEHLVAREVINSGKIQVMATYTRSEERWQWITPFDGVPPESCEPFLQRLRAHDLLRELHSFPMFRLEEGRAGQFAAWVARECGAQGAYAVPTGGARKNAQWAFLAIDLATYASDGIYDVEANPWCTCCGALPHEVRAYVKAEQNVMICESCTEDFAGVLNKSDKQTLATLDQTWVEPTAYAPHCLFCGEKVPRMFAGSFSICISCLQTCQRSLLSQAHH